MEALSTNPLCILVVRTVSLSGFTHWPLVPVITTHLECALATRTDANSSVSQRADCRITTHIPADDVMLCCASQIYSVCSCTLIFTFYSLFLYFLYFLYFSSLSPWSSMPSCTYLSRPYAACNEVTWPR